jgi:hypothetical protein
MAPVIMMSMPVVSPGHDDPVAGLPTETMHHIKYFSSGAFDSGENTEAPVAFQGLVEASGRCHNEPCNAAGF